jgi:hypothetical protein
MTVMGGVAVMKGAMYDDDEGRLYCLVCPGIYM